MNTPRPKNKHDATTTVTVIKWLMLHADSFKEYSWQQAMYKFNSEHQTKISPKTFKEAARGLEIVFKTKPSSSPGRIRGTGPKTPGYGVYIAKILKLLVRDIEKAVGDKIVSDEVNTLLSMIIGKRPSEEIEEYINNLK